MSAYRQNVSNNTWSSLPADQYTVYFGSKYQSGQFNTYDLVLRRGDTIVMVEVTGNMPDMDTTVINIAQDVLTHVPRIPFSTG